MALMKKIVLENKYVQVSNSTAKAVEGANAQLSLQALGLIVNLWSYNVEKWELYKTELYKRYGLNRKTSVSSAWDELVAAGYIIESKYRKGSSWDYIYFYRIYPFSDEEKRVLLQEYAQKLGFTSSSGFQQLKLGSSKCTVQNQHISNKKGTKDPNNKIKTKEKPNHNQVENLNLPLEVKKYIYKKNLMGYGYGTAINDSLNPLDIEKFYNTNPYIYPFVDKFDNNFINDYEFLVIIKAIVEKGPRPVKHSIGILKSYVLKMLSFKSDNSDYAITVGSEPPVYGSEPDFFAELYSRLGVGDA